METSSKMLGVFIILGVIMDDQEIATMYRNGSSVASIMKSTGWGRTKIMSAMTRTGTTLRTNASARVPEPLRPEEVPEGMRSSFDFNEQFVDGVGSNRRGLVIARQCTKCPQTYTVSVSNIRGDLKRGRKMRPGVCASCRGKIISGEGYTLIRKPEHPNAYAQGYVAEHVYVMSESLGRPLDTAVESVHHIDGDKSNNNINNLQLRNRYHGKGQAWECQECGSHNVVSVALKT